MKRTMTSAALLGDSADSQKPKFRPLEFVVVPKAPNTPKNISLAAKVDALSAKLKQLSNVVESLAEENQQLRQAIDPNAPGHAQSDLAYTLHERMATAALGSGVLADKVKKLVHAEIEDGAEDTLYGLMNNMFDDEVCEAVDNYMGGHVVPDMEKAARDIAQLRQAIDPTAPGHAQCDLAYTIREGMVTAMVASREFSDEVAEEARAEVARCAEALIGTSVDKIITEHKTKLDEVVKEYMTRNVDVDSIVHDTVHSSEIVEDTVSKLLPGTIIDMVKEEVSRRFELENFKLATTAAANVIEL